MNNKIILVVVLLIVVGLPILFWLVSPFWNNPRLDEQLPTVQDNLKSMNPEAMENFTKQTESMKGEIMEKDDSMPSNEYGIIAKSPMVARAHDVMGEALLVKVKDQYFLRFENLETINGPDLRIYLSANLSADDIIDLGPIRATVGNVNYVIPSGTDLSKYKNAMIWCRAFGVLFSYAKF